MENKIILDLYTLKHIQFMFNIHSDYSSQCNGYKDIERLIEAEEKNNHSLTKEDIESLGFKYTGGSLYDRRDECFESDKLVLVKQFQSGRLVVIKNDKGYFTESETILFSGTIKNISELKVLLKQLGIN